MSTREKQQTQRDTKKSGEHEPDCTTQVNFFPVLYNHNASDRNRHQHGEWGGHVQGNAEGEQWNGDQGLTKAKG